VNRCAICDYVEGHGSEWLNTPPDRRKLYWNPKHKEFHCSQCAKELKDSINQHNQNDLKKVWDNMTPNQKLSAQTFGIQQAIDEYNKAQQDPAEEQICEVPTIVSSLLIE
jgi:hypothetical protein